MQNLKFKMQNYKSKFKIITFAFLLVFFTFNFLLLISPTYASHCAGLNLAQPSDAELCGSRVGHQYCQGDSIFQNGDPNSGATSGHSLVENCNQSVTSGNTAGFTCSTANGAPECVPKGALPSANPPGGPLGTQCDYHEQRPDGLYICHGMYQGNPNSPQCVFDSRVTPACYKAPTSGSIDQVFGRVQAPDFVSRIGFGSAGISKFLGNVIKLIYVAAMIAFVIMILISAFQWITSGGDKDALSKARGRLTNALIGITMLALAGLVITTLGRILGFEFFQF